MFEIFRNVLILSGIGSALTLVLMLLKPLISKRVPAAWQYYIWLPVMLCMILPIWRIIPEKAPAPADAEYAVSQTAAPLTEEGGIQTETAEEAAERYNTAPAEYRRVFKNRIRVYDFIGYIWLAGVIINLASAAVSYAVFLIKKRRSALFETDSEAAARARRTLKIRRVVRTRILNDKTAPMLTGIFKPIIYLPSTEISKDKLYMIYLHELTHYKRGDLLYKWFTLAVNSVHWFNPFAYIISANVNEACEISCDAAVTRDMSADDKKKYMNVILELVGKEE